MVLNYLFQAGGGRPGPWSHGDGDEDGTLPGGVCLCDHRPPPAPRHHLRPPRPECSQAPLEHATGDKDYVLITPKKKIYIYSCKPYINSINYNNLFHDTFVLCFPVSDPLLNSLAWLYQFDTFNSIDQIFQLYSKYNEEIVNEFPNVNIKLWPLRPSVLE